jgi:SHS2 domain-containing protein
MGSRRAPDGAGPRDSGPRAAPKPYRYLPHTADVLVAVQGATLKRLFENAGAALFDLITDRATVRPRERVTIEASGLDRENLLVRLLSELLYLQDTRGWRFRSCRVTALDREAFTVRAVAAGEPFDPARHPRRREVKAITYHQVRITRRGGAWRVRLVLDV